MATQADLDWEQYQLGQQGTATGSCMNQMGLSDRPNPSPSYQQPAKTRKPSKPKAASKPNAKKAAQAAKNNEDQLGIFLGLVAFAIVGLYFYQPTEENGVAALILGGIAGVVVGKLYKVIVAGLILIGMIFLFANAA